MSRLAAPVELREANKQELLASRRRRNKHTGLHMRADVVLDCAKGYDDEEVAERIGTSIQTVLKWRRRFSAQGMRGLSDVPLPGQPRRHNDERVQQVLEKTLHERPPTATH